MVPGRAVPCTRGCICCPVLNSRPELCARSPKSNARQTISSIRSTWSCAALGTQSQIEVLYNANATEDDWVCNSLQINTIDKSQMVSQSTTQVRIAVTYYFQSSVLSPRQGGNQGQGVNTRFFIFDTGLSGQLSLVSMSGVQRGQNG